MRNADCLGEHLWRSPYSAIAIEFWVGQIKPCPISLCLLFQYCVISEIKFKCTSCVALIMQTGSPGLCTWHWLRENAWLGGRQSWVQIPASLCDSGKSLVPLNFLLLFSTLRGTLPPTGIKEKLSLRQKTKQKQNIKGCIFINFWQEHPSAVLSFLQGFKDIRKKSKF